jgi:hypothetical protein
MGPPETDEECPDLTEYLEAKRNITGQVRVESQVNRLYEINKWTFETTPNLDPVGELPVHFVDAVKKDLIFIELHRLTRNNSQRIQVGFEVIPPPERLLMVNEMGMPWVALNDTRFVAVVLNRATAFLVLYAPGKIF